MIKHFAGIAASTALIASQLTAPLLAQTRPAPQGDPQILPVPPQEGPQILPVPPSQGGGQILPVPPERPTTKPVPTKAKRLRRDIEVNFMRGHAPFIAAYSESDDDEKTSVQPAHIDCCNYQSQSPQILRSMKAVPS